MLVTPPFAPGDDPSRPPEAVLRLYADAVREAARVEGAVLADAARAFEDHPDAGSLFPVLDGRRDWNHSNAEGNARIAETILQALRAARWP